mgnify:CR=1 FL=1
MFKFGYNNLNNSNMGRRKLVHVPAFEKAKTRLASVLSIDNALDLGNNVTADKYEAEVTKFDQALKVYNTALSTLDDLYNECIAQETVLKEWNERILNGVGFKYGKDSSQYEMAGGTRKSERKKPSPKKP